MLVSTDESEDTRNVRKTVEQNQRYYQINN